MNTLTEDGGQRKGLGRREYFLGDALRSVRQLADPAGAVTLTQSYAPYGEVTRTVGTSQTSYGFTNEATDPNGLVYLRARYYAPTDGRFISRDTWNGDYNRPLSLNKWGYVEGNPVNLVDPSGHSPGVPPIDLDSLFGISFSGEWSLSHKSTVRRAVSDVGMRFSSILNTSGVVAFRSVFPDGINFKWDVMCSGCRPLSCINEGKYSGESSTGENCKPGGGFTPTEYRVTFASITRNTSTSQIRSRNNVVHELGHAFDHKLGEIPRSTLEATWSGVGWGGECFYQANFPRRGVTKGPYYGFASQIGVLDWQMNSSNSPGEEFADMFLGWVYNKWEAGTVGNRWSDEGHARSEWMDLHMRGWLTTSKRN